jgi:hypothetical protein
VGEGDAGCAVGVTVAVGWAWGLAVGVAGAGAPALQPVAASSAMPRMVNVSFMALMLAAQVPATQSSRPGPPAVGAPAPRGRPPAHPRTKAKVVALAAEEGYRVRVLIAYGKARTQAVWCVHATNPIDNPW